MWGGLVKPPTSWAMVRFVGQWHVADRSRLPCPTPHARRFASLEPRPVPQLGWEKVARFQVLVTHPSARSLVRRKVLESRRLGIARVNLMAFKHWAEHPGTPQDSSSTIRATKASANSSGSVPPPSVMFIPAPAVATK